MFLLNALHKWAAEDAVAFQEREENQSHYITYLLHINIHMRKYTCQDLFKSKKKKKSMKRALENKIISLIF